MDSVTGIANSALNAFATGQAVTANNIANINTDEFKTARTINQEGPNGGVNARVVQGNDSVDISREAISLLSNSTNFKANLKTLQTEDQMTKELINIKA